MPRRSDAIYFKDRAEASRTAASRSNERGAIIIHGQLATEYDRRSERARVKEIARAAALAESAQHLQVAGGADRRFLSELHIGKIMLGAYLADLCRNIAGSLIHDPEQIQLDLEVDESVTDPDTAIDLGLIVSELVIGALKRSFVDLRKNRIGITYRTTGQGWILAVSDSGVEMARETSSALPQLGTSVVDALARKLDAHVVIASSVTGTTVSICHG